MNIETINHDVLDTIESEDDVHLCLGHHFAPLAGRARCFFEAASLEALT